MSENESIALLRLHRIPGIGPVGARKLVRYFGSAEGIFSESIRSLVQIPGIGRITAEKILEVQHLHAARQEWERLRRYGIRCIPYWEASYPQLLRQCEDAPLVLFLKGDIPLTGQRFVSIVGTRNMTEYGKRCCEQLVADLAPYQPVIVSGLAFGVDICAQLAAIRHGLQTVACLAHGLDRVYPEQHRHFVTEILASGGLLTEFSLGTPPERMHFVRRNRIIAGLSEATVVVESASEGGSLITADLAFGYHREVFAIPGRMSDRFSRGCNHLIRDQKAHLMQSVADLVRVMNWAETTESSKPKQGKGINYKALATEERCIVDFLGNRENICLDDIAIGCGRPVKETATLLFMLEMKGLIRSMPGKRYVLADN